MADAHVRPDAAVAELASLLDEVREADGVIARGKLVARGVRVLRQLAPEQRRQLAVDVANRAAPHLVDRIEADSELDLSVEQIRTVVDLVGQLDREQLDELVEQVRDPEWQRQAAQRALRGATDPEIEAMPEVAAEPEIEIEPETDIDPEIEPETDIEIEPSPVSAYAPSMPELAGWRAEGLDADQYAFDEPEAPAHERSWFGGAELGIGEVRQEGSSLVERLQAIERPGRRLQALVDALDEFRGLDGPAQLGVLRALPDGWTRRRALDRLVTAGGVAMRWAPRLLETLDRPMDRTWVAATMLQEELVELSMVEPLLTPAAASRLRSRYGPASA